jgi:co-chaperonin GroES (HSP10)
MKQIASPMAASENRGELPMPPMMMDHDTDPAKKLVAEIGDLSTVELFNNQILVAVYIRPQKTKSGIYLSDKTVDEDRFQSKVGLLVKMGPSAFEDNAEGWFKGEQFNLNDWLVFRPSDGWNVTIHGVLCRVLTDTQVKARVKTPDEIW